MIEPYFDMNLQIVRDWESEKRDLQEAFDIIADQLVKAEAETRRLRIALEEIAKHWAISYDHPLSETEIYKGPYGIGVTDGHRCCAKIAREALDARS